jgi:outer membrane lipoprotein LolB
MPDTLLFNRLVYSLRVSGIALVLWSVTGCSGHLPQHKEVMESGKILPSSWSMNGRLSITNESENWYSGFNWVQQGDDFYIRFMGPMGQTELELRQSGKDVLLKTSSYERQSNELEQLLLQETGWRFPVHSMRYWVMGKVNPDEKASVKRNEQLITSIKQSGWYIEYSRYLQVNEYYLPKKIIVSDPPVKIKIIVTSWSFNVNSLSLDRNIDSLSN